MATRTQKLLAAGTAVLIAEPAFALAHTGGVGVIVGLAVGAIAYHAVEDVEAAMGKELPQLPAPGKREKKEREPGQLSLGQRLITGRSVREADALGDEPQKGNTWVTAQFKLDDVLDLAHAFNEQGMVYFGESEQGAIVVPLDAMYHVIDVSSSGKGKSNRFRLAMMQMVNHCETYYINPFAANVKAVIDEREIEVWKPIFDRLANKRPVKDGPEIEDLLTSLVAEITERNALEEQGDFSWTNRPLFVFIDELPEVSARCPDAMKLLDRIGRTGRQFHVFCWVASQTANVKDIGQSTAAQANYKTRIYGGGDKTSSDRLMKGGVPKDAERTLQTNGAGLTLMLADGVEGLSFVRAPLVTNEAMFDYMGLPPFRKEDWTRGKGTAQQREEPVTNVLPFTLLPKEVLQAQNPPQMPEEKGKTEKGKRVKGPNDGVILDAMEALEDEEKALTLHAIAKKAGLTRHQYDDIEEVAIEYGYELDRGKGRPAKEG